MNARLARQQGLSLLELVIATALSVAVVVAAFEILTAASQTARIERAHARVLDQARLARSLMTDALLSAGHPGCHWQFRRNLTSAEVTPAEPAITPGDALITHHFRRVAEAVATADTTSDARVMLNRAHGIPQGDLAVVAPLDRLDCSLFYQISTEARVLDRRAIEGSGNRMPEAGYLPLSGAVEIFRPETTTFYVDASVAEPGVSSLYRRRSLAGGQREELVVGVESLALRYGLDRDGDGQAEGFERAEDIADPRQIVAVEVNLVITDTRLVEPVLRCPVTFVVALRQVMP